MAEAWSTHNSKVAASLNALGWPVRIQLTERAEGDKLLGETMLQLSLYEPNVLKPGARIKELIKGWEKGTLSVQMPMHPFLIGLRACNAYEAVLRMMKGERHRLVEMAGGLCTHYVPGEELPGLMMSPNVVELRDLSLVCALSVIGFPVIGISGPAGQRSFRLPQFGHALLTAAGDWQMADIVPLIARAEPGKLPLLLEQTDPLHPLVIAYNARHVHAQLLARIAKQRRVLTLGPRKFTGRYSVASEYASDRVMDQVQRNLKLPAVPFPDDDE